MCLDWPPWPSFVCLVPVYLFQSSCTNSYQICITEAAVVGRGCSTKDKVFYKECETHNYGDSLEKMCFCSFQLCNASNQLNCPSFWTLTLLVFLATAYTATTATTVTTQTFYWIIWDPWPKSWHPYATKLPAANVKKKPSPIHSSDLFLRILFLMYMKAPSLIILKL